MAGLILLETPKMSDELQFVAVFGSVRVVEAGDKLMVFEKIMQPPFPGRGSDRVSLARLL
jgi:hypothetical protein